MKTPCHCATSESPGRYVSLFKNEVCASCNGTLEVDELLVPVMTAGLATGSSVAFKSQLQPSGSSLDYWLTNPDGVGGGEFENNLVQAMRLSTFEARFAVVCPVDLNGAGPDDSIMTHLMKILYPGAKWVNGEIEWAGGLYDYVDAFKRMKADGVFS